MKYITFIICLFFVSAGGLRSEIPIVPLPPPLTDSQLENYEDSEDIFSMKVMEMYRIALLYDSQLKFLRQTPVVTVPDPTLDDLMENDKVIIIRYYNIASKLESQIKSVTDSPQTVLADSVNKLITEMAYQKMKDAEELSRVRAAGYLDKANMIAEQDSIWNSNFAKMEDVYNGRNKRFINILSLSFFTNLFVLNGGAGRVENKVSLGTELVLNLSKVFGFWRKIDFWFQYLSPKIRTSVKLADSAALKEDWNANIVSFGTSARFNFQEDETISHGIRIALGYFYAAGYIYNKNNPSFGWDGLHVRLEYFAGVPSFKYPFEIFGGITVYQSLTDNLIYNTGSVQISAAKTQASVSLGIRYNFWRDPF